MEYSPQEITEILNGSNAKQIREIVKIIEDRASTGDARSNYMIAMWYRDGLHGFEKDKKKYNKHIKISIDKLLPDAIYDFGVSKDGKSYKKSRQALGYYILAAILGDEDAISVLIDHFVYGDILEKNDFVASSLKKRLDYCRLEE